MAILADGAPSRMPWNRNDGVGFWLSVLGPLALVLIGNALIFATGWDVGDPASAELPITPPGWFVGAAWALIFPMWGAARWYVWQTGLAGRRRSRWITGLMAWGLLHPLISGLGGMEFAAFANVAALVLVLIAAWQARGVTRRAFWLVAPSTMWIGFATVLGFAALVT